jgi:hypothetical protein
MNIRYSDYTDGNKNLAPARFDYEGWCLDRLFRPSSFEAEYESGLKYGTTVQRAGSSVQTRFYKLQEETYHEPNR